MGKDILPDDPEARRMRGRLRALRAADRLGLLGEGNLLATLAARPRLRWLADEEGARWAVLAELGRIGDPVAFEEAVEWALQNRPRPEEAGAHVRRLRSGTPPRTFEEAVDWALENRPRPEEAAAHARRLGSGIPRPEACGSLARRTALSVPRLRGATGKEERRC